MTMEENIRDGEKIVLELMYDGSSFCGWQVQKNAPSVQSRVQDALENVLSFRPDVCGCSRTDSGVHANEYVCHILKEGVNIQPERLAAALNSHLRESSVAVKAAYEKESGFHARYSCTGKEYIYKIWNERYMNPFLNGRAMHCPKKIDVESMSFFAEELCGKHDFRAFMTKGSKNESNTVRTVKYFKAEKEDGLLTLSVCADGFLYNMVRIIVGTYISLSAKGEKKGSLAEIINSLERERAGDTAPAHGLYLNRVFYD